MFLHHPKPFLTLAFACSLLLAGCETPSQGVKAKKDPVPLQKLPEEKSQLPLPADADKIARLEQQVAALEKEVAGNRPKIAKIDVIEQKFKDLSLGLDRIDATYNMKPAQAASAPVVPPVAVAAAAPLATPVIEAPKPPPAPVKEVTPPKAPAPAPVPVKKAEAPKHAASGEKVVHDLRIGEKKEYSRLVLDLGQSVKVNYDIDNDEKILLVDIPGFKWNGPKTKTFPKSLLISSYQVQTDEAGSHLVVQLRGPAKIANYSNIEATGGKLPRAVLDVAPQ